MMNLALLGMGVNAMLGVGLFLPMLPILGASGLSPLQLGILAGAFPLLEGIAGLLYPALLKRLSPRFLMVSGQVFCAISCILLIVTTDFWWLLAGRLMGGWGGASVSIAQYLIGRNHEGVDRVARLGQLGAAQAFGFVIGLAAMAVSSALLSGLAAVQAAGAFAAILGAGSAAAVLVTKWKPLTPVPASAVSLRLRLSDVPLGDLVLYLFNTFVYISLAVLMSIWAGRTPSIGVAGGSVVFIVLALFSMAAQARVAAAATRALGSLSATAAGFALACAGATLFALDFHPGPSIAGLVVARLGYSIIVPTTLGRILGDARTRAADHRAGWAMFAASIGSCAGPVITGAMQETLPLGAAAMLLSAIAALGLALVLVFARMQRAAAAPGLAPNS